MLDIETLASPFTYIGSTIHQLNIQNHLVYLGSGTSEKYEIEIIPSEVEHEKEDAVYFGTVTIKIAVTLSTENDPVQDKILLGIEGGFSAPDSIGEEVFTKMLALNGATILYSIARSKLEAITSATFARGEIVLPVVNIHQYYANEKQFKDQEKCEQTTND